MQVINKVVLVLLLRMVFVCVEMMRNHDTLSWNILLTGIFLFVIQIKLGTCWDSDYTPNGAATPKAVMLYSVGGQLRRLQRQKEI